MRWCASKCPTSRALPNGSIANDLCDQREPHAMTFFVYRRFRNAVVTMAALVAFWWWMRIKHRALEPTAFTTGYLLAAAIAFLAFYNIRKRLPMLPLGSSATWLQWHLYVGLGTIAIYTLHAGTSPPHGVLDTSLAAVYWLTISSGLCGLYLTRTIPVQLSRVGEEVIYERIPAYRQQVRKKARELVFQSVETSGTSTLADFYSTRLLDYFEQPRGIGYRLRPTTARRRALMREMHDVRRYLSDQEQICCEKLFALVRKKDDLDFHEARQGALKLWLFVHIGLTVVLVLLAALHGLVAHAFHGGAL